MVVVVVPVGGSGWEVCVCVGGGGYKCQLSVKILDICQLSVNWLLIIN